MSQGVQRRGRELLAEGPRWGPFRRDFWRSPVRGPWLAAVFSLLLLLGIPIVFVTGLISSAAWNPDLGGTNDQVGRGILGFYLGWEWPTRPTWLFRVNNGTHLLLGIAIVPVLLAKLWVVMPTLFKWPPVTSMAEGLERFSHAFLMGGIFFQTFTGLFFIQNWVVFTDVFNRLHFYGGWVFMGAFVLHVVAKTPKMVAGLRSRRLRTELRTPLAATEREPLDDGRLVTTNPAEPTISRRGVLGMVVGTSAAVVALAAPQTWGQRWRWLTVLSPRAQHRGDGPNDFQVNKTAERAGITAEQVGPGWRLELAGPTPRVFSREDLLALPQHTAPIAINCLEGWSTGDQDWTGVRLRDLAALAGMPDPAKILVHSLEAEGRTTERHLRGNQVADPDSLLALRVNGAELSMDHGYPARIIVPGNVGNSNLKWVRRIEVFDAI